MLIFRGDGTHLVFSQKQTFDRVWTPVGSPKMPCKSCASDNLQSLAGELTASLPGLKNLKVSPIYVCQEILVCLDCGFTELRLTAAELQQLKKGRGVDR